MQITKDDQIAGVSAIAVRAAFRTMRGRSYATLTQLHAQLAEGLDCSLRQARDVAQALIADGYIQHNESGRLHVGYVLAPTGLRLASASTGKPIPRARAELLLAELIERARQINADDTWSRVTRIEVFGSYLDASRATIGDIDLMITLADRYHFADFDAEMKAHSTYVFTRSKGGMSITAELSYPLHEIYVRLRNRRRCYGLLSDDEHARMRQRTEVKVVFEDVAPPVAPPAALLADDDHAAAARP
jgi:predicted nucleotidyltransferase